MLAGRERPASARILSMRQDGLKSGALNGQGCRLRTGRMQEGLHRPVPSSFGRKYGSPCPR